tara:strand:- start:2387 stop:3427 length:1041 start_codon:yes stop_codon:yes gene_type:complete
MKKKIAIIGAGWFGCHIASEIIKLNKFDIQIFEKNNEIFQGASTNNQNRLHLGFHYPRSKETRVQSKKGFKKFLEIYPFLCSKVKNNMYGVANHQDSQIDFGTFLQVMKSENLKYKEVNAKQNFGIEGLSGAILTHEMLIDSEKSKKFFKKKLRSFLHLNMDIKKIEKIKDKYKINDELFDYVINCTYYQKFVKKNPEIVYEVTSSIIYKCNKNFPALTVMDGPFFTIYPYKKNLYNVYSVTHSRFGLSRLINKCENILSQVRNDNTLLHLKKKLAEKQILTFYPKFLKHFKFKKFLTCIRTINKSKNADRSYKVYFNENLINVYSGKIDHISLAGEEIIKFLQNR